MAETTQPVTSPWPGSVRIRTGSVISLICALILLAPIALFNSYVFSESNLPILFVLMASFALIASRGMAPRGIVFPGVLFGFLVLATYSWARMDDPWDLNLGLFVEPGVLRPGFSYIVDIITFYLLFVVSALLYYKKQRFSPFLWFLISGYIAAFIIRNSDVVALQEGYNLSPGFVLISFLPFLFMRTNEGRPKNQGLPLIILAVCILWLSLIGARTAVGALLIFPFVLYTWPLITKNRFVYYLSFWTVVVSLALLCVLYLAFAVRSKEALVEGSSVGILQKDVGTRVNIWGQLAYLISQAPWFGHGTGEATLAVTQLALMNLSSRRENLSAHSTYFEILYRVGTVGLVFYILVLFSIWMLYWKGRDSWITRVAGSFLICNIFFGATGEYLVFSEMQLRSGFGWIILGIGAGACLRAINETRARGLSLKQDTG